MDGLKEYKDGSFKGEKDARLLFVNKENKSVWKKKKDKSETILIYSHEGKLLKQGTIYYPDGVSETGFWTCVDEWIVIYKNYFYEDWMEMGLGIKGVKAYFCWFNDVLLFSFIPASLKKITDTYRVHEP